MFNIVSVAVPGPLVLGSRLQMLLKKIHHEVGCSYKAIMCMEEVPIAMGGTVTFSLTTVTIDVVALFVI